MIPVACLYVFKIAYGIKFSPKPIKKVFRLNLVYSIGDVRSTEFGLG